jgi:hypothetical protein
LSFAGADGDRLACLRGDPTNRFIPQMLVYGGSIQYSMPYLKSEIRDYQLPTSSTTSFGLSKRSLQRLSQTISATVR